VAVWCRGNDVECIKDVAVCRAYLVLDDLYAQMWPIATAVTRWSVCLCVCLCVGHTSVLCKIVWTDRAAAWSWLILSPGNHVLGGGQDWMNPFAVLRGDKTAMWLCVITLDTCYMNMNDYNVTLYESCSCLARHLKSICLIVLIGTRISQVLITCTLWMNMLPY